MPDGKWVSKENLQTFWQMIRSKSLPTMIGDTVTTWLNDHVTPTGSAVVVDNTLTIQGAAADAKKTGDEISGLKEDSDDLKSAFDEAMKSGFHIGKSINETENTPTYTNGWLRPNGEVVASSAYHYTSKISVQPGDIVKRITGGDMEAVCAYNDNTPVESKGVNSAIASYIVPDGINYVAITVYSGFSGKILVITALQEIQVITDDVIIDSVFKLTAKTINTTVDGWRLNEANGLCESNESYKLVKYAVTAGDLIVIKSDDRFQFQNNISVPSSRPSNKVGMTYGIGTFCMKVPIGATYLIFSTPIIGTAEAYDAESFISTLAKENSAWS